MATLISNASGNLTGAATFAATEVGAGALNLIRFNHVTTLAAAATVTSVTFTVTAAKVIDGVLLWVRQGAAGSTGTFKVDLQKGGVSQASVTVNKTDLPDTAGVNNAPVFFKFTGTATGDGGSTWTIVLTTTGTQVVFYGITASGVTNITHALRTTTAQTAAAGDDLYVVGELTGAATHNSFTVTMNSTAATVYGNGAVNSTTVNGGLIAVSNYGTLSYGVSASTNYILRVAGDIRVNQYGTLRIGAAGAEIPRSSTAVLEFQQVSAVGDFGLYAYDNAVVSIAGLSRTSGKDVVKCKLTADVVGSSVLTSGSVQSATVSLATQLDATGTSLLGGSVTETATTAVHGYSYSGPSVTNVTQTATVWLAQGAGPANNRYVRLTVGNNSVQSSVTNGFYSDLDLQAGTAGTVTAVGTGTATSVSIAAQGAGWLVKMTGRVASGAAAPSVLINSCTAPGTLSYAGSTSNQNFIFDHLALVTAASIADTTFNVDADTGWLSGDTVCVTSTSRIYQECTLYPLNANAGASSFTSPLYPANQQVAFAGQAFTHSGTVPFQAEVGLLTRNVKIRSTSATLTSFFYCAALATITVSWAEFSRLGTITGGKRGIEVDCGTVANAKSFTYCSLHDFLSSGFFTAAGFASFNAIYSNNVSWFSGGASITINAAITNNDWTLDNNLVMRGFSYGFVLSDIGGVCTNNTVCGCNSQYAFYLAELAGTIGTFSNNTAHSTTGGINLISLAMQGIIANYTAWRMTVGNGGVLVNVDCPDILFTNITLFGNLTVNIVVTSGDLTIVGGTISGDTLFATTNGISIPGGSTRLNLSNVDMSGVGTGLAPHTGVDFINAAQPSATQIVCNNCKFGAPSLLAKTFWASSSYASFEKYNQIAGDHRTEMKYGQLRTDSTMFNSSLPSMRMTPNNATAKLESAPDGRGIQAAVNNGGTVTASVYVIKDASYIGSQPRLIVRANPAVGIASDAVLATYSAGTGSWNVLSGTTAAVSDDGVLEFIVDCDSAGAGFINIDDWSFV